MKLGFIGLGIMGTPMALRLAKAGHALHVTTIGPVADELLKHGAQHLACAEQVAEQSDIIFIMVPDTPQVAEVLFGEHGCAKEGANKQVISSQADSLIKISRIWAD
ncbi:NAD(P)-binding domain-containing protein, partial [Klebsiella pneumoniae]|nr:NAD(P)-binding domain-containing protein [Klebsiella pneumoniae]